MSGKRCPSFSPAVRRQMVDIYVQSYNDNREHAAPLCGSQESPTIHRVRKGEKTSAFVSSCPRSEKPVGYVHTHPHTSPHLSENDVVSGVLQPGRFACVIGNSKAPFMAGSGEEDERAEPKNLTVRCLDKEERQGVTHEMIEAVRAEWRKEWPIIKKKSDQRQDEWNKIAASKGSKVRIKYDPFGSMEYFYFVQRYKENAFRPPEQKEYCSVRLT